MSNLVNEILLRLVKPGIAVLLGALVFAIVATGWARRRLVRAGAAVLDQCGAAFILLVQESPL